MISTHQNNLKIKNNLKLKIIFFKKNHDYTTTGLNVNQLIAFLAKSVPTDSFFLLFIPVFFLVLKVF